jgi:hypothetical protein
MGVKLGLTLREKHRMRMFENRVLRRIFGPKGDWRKLHNEELHSLYSSPSISRVIVKDDETGRACSTNGGEMNAYRILVGNPEGKRPLGRPRRRWIWLKIGTSGGLS